MALICLEQDYDYASCLKGRHVGWNVDGKLNDDLRRSLSTNRNNCFLTDLILATYALFLCDISVLQN